MCFATVAAIAAVGAGAVAAVGSIDAGNSAKKAANANAAAAREKAQSELDAAHAEAMQIQQDTARKMGDAKAAFGASGVVMSSGTPLDVMSDLATQGELSRQMRLYQGNLAARSDEQQANIDVAQGKAAQRAGYYGAGSSLLGSVSRVAAMPGMAPTPTAPKIDY